MPIAVHEQSQCCHLHPQTVSMSDRLLPILEKVSAIALGFFAAYAAFELFFPFFLLGTAVGLYTRFSAAPQRELCQASVSCSQGFLEQLTKVKLPPILSLGANLAITWCHIDHHTTVFVPVIALSLGAWAGQSLGGLKGRVCPISRSGGSV